MRVNREKPIIDGGTPPPSPQELQTLKLTDTEELCMKWFYEIKDGISKTSGRQDTIGNHREHVEKNQMEFPEVKK